MQNPHNDMRAIVVDLEEHGLMVFEDTLGLGLYSFPRDDDEFDVDEILRDFDCARESLDMNRDFQQLLQI